MANPYPGFNYQAYLRTDAWRERREAVIERDGTCRRCEVAMIEDIHHLTYERVGREPLFDLVGLCHRCHQIVHGLLPDLLEINVGKQRTDKEAVSHEPHT